MHILDDYKPKAVLGKGVYGEVIEARHRESQELVAIKKIKVNKNPILYARILREIQIMKQLSAMEGSEQHVTQLLDIKYPDNFFDEENTFIFLVLDLMPCSL